MSEYNFPAENPPENKMYRAGRTGRLENPRTRAAIETMRHNPNTWFRLDEMAYNGKNSHSLIGGRGYMMRKKAAKEGIAVEYTSRRVGSLVRLYGRVVVEG